MVYVKVHKREGQVLVAACDKNIIGASFSEGDRSLTVLPNFYQGEQIGLEELHPLLSEATIANLVGSGVVDYALKKGYIEKENIMEVSGIPHAQFVLF